MTNIVRMFANLAAHSLTWLNSTHLVRHPMSNSALHLYSLSL